MLCRRKWTRGSLGCFGARSFVASVLLRVDQEESPRQKKERRRGRPSSSQSSAQWESLLLPFSLSFLCGASFDYCVYADAGRHMDRCPRARTYMYVVDESIPGYAASASCRP